MFAIANFVHSSDFGRPGALLMPLVAHSVPAAVPLLLATRGGKPWAVFLRSLVVMAAVYTLVGLVSMARTEPDRSVFPAPLCGAMMAAVGFGFTYPAIAHSLRSANRPRERNVAAETALLGGYGLFVSFGSMLMTAGFDVCAGRVHRSLVASCAVRETLRPLPTLSALATLAVGVVGLAWEFRARRRVRTLLAGGVPGWIARPARDVPGAGSVPFLRWLGRPRRSPDPTAADETTLLLRVPSDPAAPGYRGSPGGAVPWVRVPPDVSYLSELVLASAVVTVGAAWALWKAAVALLH